MTSWRDQILNQFTPKVARLTLVADPDGLLLEEGILEGIRQRGFELIPFEDHIAFRHAYESNFRSRWDRGEHTDLVVVLRSQISDLSSLPFDLLQAGRKITFNLGAIFPNLSYPVVAALDRGDLEALSEAEQRYAPGQLGENATKEFLLRHVFEIAPEGIKQSSDLLRVLLRRHYSGRRIPKVLDDRFIHILQQNDTFKAWPLEIIVPDREAFFGFLQERWVVFLNHLLIASQPTAREECKSYGFIYSGPVDLPFDHHDVKVYIDNLFTEGLLQTIPHERAAVFVKTWAVIGVRFDPMEDRCRRLGVLISRIRSSMPEKNVRYTDWLLFARGWAEILATACEVPAAAKAWQEIKGLQTSVDESFGAWLSQRYAGLVNLPPTPPVMLHHLPRFLARHMDQNSDFKAALLVIDGLALHQWIVARESIASQRPDLRFREGAIFAWIPTLTSVSRQATFAGKLPMFFPDSIQTTEREPLLWGQFWTDQGLAPNEFTYEKGLGDGSMSRIEQLLSNPKLRVAALTIDKIDKIIHGMQLGTIGMQGQVRQWAEQDYIASFLDLLLDHGFHIFLTSDHGNIEAAGCGVPSEGVAADLRGERVRVYSDPLLRSKMKVRFPAAVEWPQVGLPPDYLPLLAPNRKAFIRENERSVSHGGPSIEETIVPLVQIERNCR